MKPWQQWNRYEWSDALLDSYFGLVPEGPSEPVRILVVTDDRLRQVVGETSASQESVRLSLIEKTIRSAGAKNFWRHAADGSTARPEFLAHLIVGCIAAVDSADLDERSYLKRLEEIAGPSASQSIELMPELWGRLQSWLAERPDEYRPIVLPDPRGWTRIGHTTRLAFPSRADQARLRAVLAEEGATEDLPLGVVVGALGRGRRAFSKRFTEELDAFEAAMRTGASAAALYETPLWSAVVSASWLDLDDPRVDGRQRWTILGTDDGYELDLRVVTSGEEAPPGFVLGECSEVFGQWSSELLDEGDRTALHALLSDELPRLGNVSTLVRNGLIPLMEAPHGALEVAAKQDLDSANVALVADSLLSAVQARFGGVASRLAGTTGWSAVRGVHLRTAPPEDLDGTDLERCWIVHDTPFPTSLRLIGGVRIGEAFIGKPSMLPRVRAAGATSVTATLEDLEIELVEQDGYWHFPSARRTVNGDADMVIRARFPTGEKLRRLRFVSAPSVESIKTLGDPAAWQIEGNAASQALTSAHEMYSADLSPALAEVDSVTRLSRDVGIFASSQNDTTWEIAAFGTERSGRLIGPADEAVPTTRSLSDGDRRRWRQCLSSARFPDGDPAGQIARHVIANGRSDKELPVADPEGGISPEHSGLIPCRSRESSGVGDLVDLAVALANRRAGIDPPLWRRLGQEALDIDRPQFDLISRAWAEGHLIDETVSRRWSTRRMMVIAPHLVAFRTDRWIGASLQGLALSSTRVRLQEIATAASALVEPVRSRSGLIPEGLAVRCDSMEQLRSIADRADLPIWNLRPDPLRLVPGRDLTTTPPGNYERSTYRSNLPDLDGVTTARWWRSGSPGLWTVESNLYATWTHFEESAAFWAAAFAGQRALIPADGGRLRRETAFAPLATARWLNAVAPVRSGPDPTAGNAYFYETPSEAFALSLLTQMDLFITQRLAGLPAPRSD
jgi:hypothetical protein